MTKSCLICDLIIATIQLNNFKVFKSTLKQFSMILARPICFNSRISYNNTFTRIFHLLSEGGVNVPVIGKIRATSPAGCLCNTDKQPAK